MSFTVARVCIVLGTLLATGCASGVPQQTAALSTVAVTKAPDSIATPPKPRPAIAVAAPTWKSDRKAWCQMRERQKAAAKSPNDPIAGTTDPYLISVHDQMCQATAG